MAFRPLGFRKYGFLTGTANVAFTPAALFAAGETGAWYDPSDLTTMFQDSAGTTPVTATGQTVGLLLDKSKGLVLGPELVTNGTFDTDTDWNKETGWSISGGRANSSAASGFGAISQSKPELVEGRAYRVSFEITSYTSGTVSVAVGTNGGVAINSGNKNAVGVYTFVGTFPVGATKRVYARQENGFVGSIDNISVKELPGNHATQATAASRPIYGIEPFGGRRNLLTYTEQFDNAVWVKQRAILTPDATTAPDGTLTADRIEPNATHPSAAGLVIQSITISAGATVNGSFYFKAGNATWAMFRVDDNGTTNTASIWFNIAAGTVGTTSATGSGVGVSSGAVVSVGNGWYRCSAAFTTTAVTTIRFYAYGAVDANGSTASTLGNFAFIWGAQLETGSTATAYQRVTDQWNVTQAGVPSVSYIQCDGTDDFLLTGTITPGIDKAQVFAGVRKLSDAAVGAVVEAGVGVGASGELGMFAAFPANGYTMRSRGTITADAASPTTYTSPITNVLTGTGDIAGDRSTLRINGSQVAQNTADQGTGNYLANPLYIGRRAGTSLPYNGRIYQMIVRFGANLSAATITQTESYTAAKTGIYTVEQLIRLNTLNASGVSYNAYAAADSNGNNYPVTNTVLAADGTPYSVL